MTFDPNTTGTSRTTDTTSGTHPSRRVMAMATDATFAIGTFDISAASRSWLSGGISSVEPPFDARRVATIKAAIDGGRYVVDAQALANRMLDGTAQLLSGGS